MKGNSLQSHHLLFTLQAEKLLTKKRLKPSNRAHCFHPGQDEQDLDSWRVQSSRCARRKVTCMWGRARQGGIDNSSGWRAADNGNVLSRNPRTLCSGAPGIARQGDSTLAATGLLQALGKSMPVLWGLVSPPIFLFFCCFFINSLTNLCRELPPFWLPVGVTLINATEKSTRRYMWWS